LPNCANCKKYTKSGMFCMAQPCREAKHKYDWVNRIAEFRKSPEQRAQINFRRRALRARAAKRVISPPKKVTKVNLVYVAYKPYIAEQDKLLQAALADPQVMHNRESTPPYRGLVCKISDFSRALAKLPSRKNQGGLKWPGSS